nr:MAG TPA: hypothetical protein [Caudoviricetes sp.]
MYCFAIVCYFVCYSFGGKEKPPYICDRVYVKSGKLSDGFLMPVCYFTGKDIGYYWKFPNISNILTFN